MRTGYEACHSRPSTLYPENIEGLGTNFSGNLCEKTYSGSLLRFGRNDIGLAAGI
jgi:hypothetical protein